MEGKRIEGESNNCGGCRQCKWQFQAIEELKETHPTIESKKKSTWKKCGERGHWWSDFVCPKYEKKFPKKNIQKVKEKEKEKACVNNVIALVVNAKIKLETKL